MSKFADSLGFGGRFYSGPRIYGFDVSMRLTGCLVKRVARFRVDMVGIAFGADHEPLHREERCRGSRSLRFDH